MQAGLSEWESKSRFALENLPPKTFENGVFFRRVSQRPACVLGPGFCCSCRCSFVYQIGGCAILIGVDAGVSNALAAAGIKKEGLESWMGDAVSVYVRVLDGRQQYARGVGPWSVFNFQTFVSFGHARLIFSVESLILVQSVLFGL